MKETFVPRSYFLKLRGELQDLRQGAKSVMDYYYKLISLISKIGVSEPEESTQDHFIHGLNIPLKYKVQVEALREIILGEVLGLSRPLNSKAKRWPLPRRGWCLANSEEGRAQTNGVHLARESGVLLQRKGRLLTRRRRVLSPPHLTPL
ncbi:hypothetical protein AAHA92_06379 [Salvia divinorum]|uniref:Retrotransposon gag domain-containing protein n=1 Tax=Salvia divinorum TaxID=28513 RepID=A0ABD1I5F7_SALDI